MVRKAFGWLLTAALAVSWAGPLCAQPDASSHACCVGEETPMPAPAHNQAPDCCRAPDALPVGVGAAIPVSAPALLNVAVTVVVPAVSGFIATPRFVPAAPQAPPGTHSGLAPPSSGL